MHRAVPPIFAAWRGNQFPPLEQKKKNGRWQILFLPVWCPPFDLFEGEAQLSKAYLARLKRIDEMAYGMAPHSSVLPVTTASLLSGTGCGTLHRRVLLAGDECGRGTNAGG